MLAWSWSLCGGGWCRLDQESRPLKPVYFNFQSLSRGLYNAYGGGVPNPNGMRSGGGRGKA